MTYYEELGISADAAEEDIRQAHRRLVKLLHPDQQLNDELRRMAELQMMRVNSVVEQLLDPTQRKLYDLALRRPLPAYKPPAATTKAVDIPEETILKGWKYAVAGISVALLAWIFTSSSPTDVIRSVTAGVLPGTTASASDSVPPKPKPAAVAKIAVRSSSPMPQQQLPVVPVPERSQVSAAADPKPAETVGAAHPAPTPSETIPAQPKAADPVPAPASQTLSGVWLYAGGKRTAEDERLYKPEYIELRIQDEGGVLHGEYRSRYAVTDLPISPAVNFSFQGNIATTLPWKGPKGSSGTVVLKLLNKNAMQVDWKVAEVGDSGIGLEFGTAVLIRRL